MITQRAESGSSTLRATCLLEPAIEAGIGGGLQQPRKMLIRVAGEVEVEVRDRALHHSPHRLAEVRHEDHQPEARKPVGVRSRASFHTEVVLEELSLLLL